MAKTMHDSETPVPGQQVITATAFIHYDFGGTVKVFMPKRADTKKFLPGLYELPGGHIEFGEDIVAGLKREIKEEFDMQVNIGDPFAAFTYKNNIKGSHSIEVVYFAQFIGSIEQIVLHPDDHSIYNWFTRDETINLAGRSPNDPELAAVLKGFALLSGDRPHF